MVKKMLLLVRDLLILVVLVVMRVKKMLLLIRDMVILVLMRVIMLLLMARQTCFVGICP